MSLLDKIKEKLKTINSIEKLIYCIIAVFIIQNLVGTFSFFQNKLGENFVIDYLAVTTSTNNFLIKSYTLLTYTMFEFNTQDHSHIAPGAQYF